MAGEFKGDRNKMYKCNECRLGYKEKKWAEKCEAWCKKHKSCNLGITSHSLKNEMGVPA